MKWPQRIIDEYEAFDNNMEKKYAGELIDLIFDTTMPPCFFAGDLNKAKFGLLGLNPGLAKGRDKELKVYKCKKWDELYLNFFTIFRKQLKINSTYYAKFAVLLSGVIDEPLNISVNRRYELLQENLVNFDLIPYHSKSFKLGMIEDEKLSIIQPYIDITKELIHNSSVEYLFISGKPWSSLLYSNENPLEYFEKNVESKKIGTKNIKLNLRYGECLGKPAVWFDKFITSIRGLRNEDLYYIGLEIRKKWHL